MINNEGAAPLGPRPAAPAARPALSRARAAVLEVLESGAGPASLAQLAAASGQHPNTLREHLDGLLAAGLVRRETAVATGRGRPAWLYAPATAAGRATAEYAGLTAALAAVLSRTSPTPAEDAVDAGTGWGHELARAAGRPESAGEVGARRQVVAVLGTMGFAPEVDLDSDPGHTTVHLTRCPLLDAARRFPDVVCGVHLGVARGALEEYGADPGGTALLPFAEPGACLLRLAGAEGTRGSGTRHKPGRDPAV
ncbi:MAG TPA: helix-turn-helix domain-containing protein [Dermatophilaceae bacterium]|nr:helix-turn-helix domain-containing protein [Dermatophilaceae bacterium]